MYYRMIELLRVILPRLLEKIFGQLSVKRGEDGAAYYKFDRLNLDLGRVRLADLEETLQSRLADKISAELVRRLPTRTDETGRFIQMLEDYLTTGATPWNGLDLDLRHWESRLPGLLGRLSEDGGRGEDAARLRALLADPLKMRRLRALLGGLGLGEVYERLEAALPGAQAAAARVREDFDGSRGATESIAQKDGTRASRYGVGSKADLQDPERSGLNTAGEFVLTAPFSGEGLSGQTRSRTFVNNAGLALLAPFLQHYFRRLGLLDERGGFKSRQHRAVAAVALQAACEPESEFALAGRFHEGELILNKLLCGWPFDWPLELDEPFPVPRGEAQALLDAVIWQWNALGGMARPAFAEAFLRRSATLLFDGHYRLHVEHKPQDALLARLPWALSILATPWTERPLEVIWDC